MKKTLLLACAALLAASSAFAATSIVQEVNRGYVLKRDSVTIGQPHSTEASCWEAAAAHVETARRDGNYWCAPFKGRRYKYSATAPTCPPAPAPTTATIACPLGYTGSWLQTTTSTVGPAPACVVTTTTSPLAAPAGACTPNDTPPPVTGSTVYLSDCQPGAAAGCVAGDNANPGTQESPKLDLAGVNFGALPEGSAIYFARGGAWTGVNLYVRNANATSTAPIQLDAYGTGPAPWLRTSSGTMFLFGSYNETGMDGGYSIRNLKLDGSGTAQWGFFVQGKTRAVTIANNEITGFEIAVHMQNTPPEGNQGLFVRNNHIHGNREMGMLGDAHGLVIEGNLIEANNFSGSGFNHGIYLGGHTLPMPSAIVRSNTFRNNSVCTVAPCANNAPPSNECQGGNLTVHGVWDGLLIEGNTIEQVASTYGCWGISVNGGYTEAEVFRNLIVRENQLINLESAINLRSAPGVIVERNRVRSNQTGLPSGVSVAPGLGNDDAGVGATVTDNVVCFTDPARTMTNAMSVSVASATVTGTVLRSGADATTGVCAP